MSAVYPATRSAVYKLLSLGFGYPAPALFKAFQNGEFLTELWDNISALPHQQHLMEEKTVITRTVRDELEGITSGDLESVFIQTFDAGIPAPPFPLYEGSYRGEPRTSIMLEISEFYKHFGLVTCQKEGKREFPDHLCTELEFLHFLTFREAEAVMDNEHDLLKGYLLAQKDFLERHLMLWVPKLCNRLQSSSHVPLYTQLAMITSIFITNDLEWLSTGL